MFTKTITINADAAKKYGLASAALLQELHNRNAALDWIAEDTLIDDCGWWQPQTVKRMVTTLENNGHLTTTIGDDCRMIRLGGRKHKKATEKPSAQTALFAIPKKRKAKREKTPVQLMNEALRRVTKSGEMIGYTRYLPFAKKLLNADYTHEDIESWYGTGGWWYQHYWKGHRNFIPSQKDISETIEDAKNNVQQKSGVDTKKSLWEK